MAVLATVDDIEAARLEDGLDDAFALVAPRFRRREARARARACIAGMLSGLERKTGWSLAEHAGERTPDGMQRLFTTAKWDEDLVRDDLRGYVTAALGGPEGVSLVRGQATGTVRYADCAALLKWPDGARELVGRDALTIRIEPALWRLTKHAGVIDSKVAADRQVTMPYRPKEQIPRPWTRRRTRVAGRILIEPVMAVLTGVVPVVAILILLAKLTPKGAGIGAAVLVPALLVGINAGRTARARLLMRAAKQNARGN